MALYCPNCGYNLYGCESESGLTLRCPECGVESDRSDLILHRLHHRRELPGLIAQVLLLPLLFAFLFVPVSCISVAALQSIDNPLWILISASVPLLLCVCSGYYFAKAFIEMQRVRGRLNDSSWVVRSFPACWVLFSLVEFALTVGYIGGCVLVISQM